MRTFIWSLATRVRYVALVGALVAGGGGVFYLAVVAPHRAAGHASLPIEQPSAASAVAAAKLERSGRDAICVPEPIARNIGLTTQPIANRTRPIQLAPFQGCLALDNNRLSRVHARFAGEVVALGETVDKAPRTTSGQSPPPRAVRVGDAVHAGDLLAVLWSKDLGEKKSELVDAVSRLRTDETTYRRLQEAYTSGSVPERAVRDAERAVEADQIALEKAERTLRSWRLSEAEIAAVRAEADRRGVAGGRPLQAERWARVEVRAPQDGQILEKNVVVGDIVDTAADLFKIGDLKHLVVWAHIYEEDLPLLQSLPAPVTWTVSVPSRPGVAFSGPIDHIAAVIDPNQHTALATGRVENRGGDLRVGQFVTVSVALPPPQDEIELPAEAVVEDGRESVVFLQPDPGQGRYLRTSVHVTRRFRDAVCVRADQSLTSGARVVMRGALLLRDAMDQLPMPAAAP